MPASAGSNLARWKLPKSCRTVKRSWTGCCCSMNRGWSNLLELDGEHLPWHDCRGPTSTCCRQVASRWPSTPSAGACPMASLRHLAVPSCSVRRASWSTPWRVCRRRAPQPSRPGDLRGRGPGSPRARGGLLLSGLHRKSQRAAPFPHTASIPAYTPEPARYRGIPGTGSYAGWHRQTSSSCSSTPSGPCLKRCIAARPSPALAAWPRFGYPPRPPPRPPEPLEPDISYEGPALDECSQIPEHWDDTSQLPLDW